MEEKQFLWVCFSQLFRVFGRQKVVFAHLHVCCWYGCAWSAHFHRQAWCCWRANQEPDNEKDTSNIDVMSSLEKTFRRAPTQIFEQRVRHWLVGLSARSCIIWQRFWSWSWRSIWTMRWRKRRSSYEVGAMEAGRWGTRNSKCRLSCIWQWCCLSIHCHSTLPMTALCKLSLGTLLNFFVYSNLNFPSLYPSLLDMPSCFSVW